MILAAATPAIPYQSSGNEHDGIPVVPATLVRTRPGHPGLLVVSHCVHCGSRHVHGEGGGYGHRVAHCVRKSPDNRGYVLVPAVEVTACG